MKLFGYEWLKLWQRRLFVILAGLLLAANLLTLYILEKNTSAFFYVCENRDMYQAFQSGDTSVDSNGWYQEQLDAHSAYQQSYAAFIGEMASRAEQMRATALFSDQDSFVYRNLRQTCADFAPFGGLERKLDNDFGLRALSDYDSGVLFLLVFLAVLAYFVIFYERDAGLTLLNSSGRMYVSGLENIHIVYCSLAVAFIFAASLWKTGKIVDNPVFAMINRQSYNIYLSHCLVLYFADGFTERLITSSQGGILIMRLICCYGVTFVCWGAYDRVKRLKRVKSGC